MASNRSSTDLGWMYGHERIIPKGTSARRPLLEKDGRDYKDWHAPRTDGRATRSYHSAATGIRRTSPYAREGRRGRSLPFLPRIAGETGEESPFPAQIKNWRSVSPNLSQFLPTLSGAHTSVGRV